LGLNYELLRLGEHGIHVPEYFTELPARELFRTQLHEAIERAKERLAGRDVDEIALSITYRSG
jgi:hypothetical protein